MKKILKTSLCMILSLLLAFSVIAAGLAAAQETAPLSDFTVKAAAKADSKEALGALSWWYNEADGKYYMFMPAGADLSSVTVWFEATGDVYCAGAKLESGQPTTAFAQGGSYTLTVSGVDYQLVFISTSELPSIFINTESGSLDAIHADKSHKEKGDLLALDPAGDVVYDNILDSIKGRGNSTWGMNKKPYNIKLNKSTDLFGLGKAKNWCLIANYEDHTLVRNQIVYGMGKAIGMSESPDCLNIDLYINGEYYGVYQLTEKVEIKENRVEIYDLEGATEDVNADDLENYAAKGFIGDLSSYIEGTQRWRDIPNDPEITTGGYLLELELASRYPDEASGFVTTNGQAVVVKSPEYATKNQIDYISGYWQELEDALYSADGYNSAGRHFSEYIDMAAFAKQYIIQEWTCNWDAGTSSNFFHKDVNGKLVAGPLWDFDTSLKNSDGRPGYNLKDPTTWHARVRMLHYSAWFGNGTVKNVPNIYALGFRHADFIDEVWTQWETKFYSAAAELLGSKLDEYVNTVKGAAIANSIRWNYYDVDTMAAIEEEYMAEVDYMRGYIVERTDFLNNNLGLHNEPLTIESIPSQKHTGRPIVPEVTVKCVDRILTQDVDYTLAFEENLQKGVATVTVTGIGDYAGRSASTTFKIIAISDPLNWTGGAGEQRAKENLVSIGEGFVDAIELICYYISRPFMR